MVEQKVPYLVAKQFMVNVARNGSFIDGEGFHRRLHTIEGRRFPHEIDDEIVRAFGRRTRGILQFDPHLMK